MYFAYIVCTCVIRMFHVIAVFSLHVICDTLGFYDEKGHTRGERGQGRQVAYTTYMYYSMRHVQHDTYR
jgi:hypothetical protein